MKQPTEVSLSELCPGRGTINITSRCKHDFPKRHHRNLGVRGNFSSAGKSQTESAHSLVTQNQQAGSNGGVINAIMTPLREPTEDETAAFSASLLSFKNGRGKPDALVSFLEKNPSSPWAATASMALGMLYRDFQEKGKAIAAFRKAQHLFAKAAGIKRAHGLSDWAGLEADELEAGSRENLRKRLGGVTISNAARLAEDKTPSPKMNPKLAVETLRNADSLGFLPPTLCPMRAPTVRETQKLAEAIEAQQKSGNSKNLQPYLDYLKQFPRSAWAAPLHLSLARLLLTQAKPSEALDHAILAEQLSRARSARVHENALAFGDATYIQLQEMSYDQNFSSAISGSAPLIAKLQAAVQDASPYHRQFEWDEENRLVAVNLGPHRTECTYDGLGRRVRIVENEINNGQVSVTADRKLLWVGTQIAEERTGDDGGTVVKRFFPQGFVDNDGTVLLYTRDHLGSIRELVDMSQTLRARYDYDPYGNVTKVMGDRDSVFLYTGHFWDGRNGLYLTLYRAYDPVLGRWLSRDPIGENGGINLYAYVENDPVDFADPLGLDIWIEGPSGNEPVGHQSINVGDPNGDYRSFSFGLDTLYLVGHPYLDMELGGEIEEYATTTRLQDMYISNELWKLWEEGKGQMYGPTTCRTWSQDRFDDFLKKFNLKKRNPPVRGKPTKRSWWRYPSSTSGSSSSTTSSGNLYPGGPSR